MSAALDIPPDALARGFRVLHVLDRGSFDDVAARLEAAITPFAQVVEAFETTPDDEWRAQVVEGQGRRARRVLPLIVELSQQARDAHEGSSVPAVRTVLARMIAVLDACEEAFEQELDVLALAAMSEEDREASPLDEDDAA